MGRNKLQLLKRGAVGLVGVTAILPFCYLLVTGVWKPSSGFTVQGYYEAFLASPKYLLRFWKSLGLCLCIVVGQLLVSIFGGFGFAKCRFKGRSFLFFLLLSIMILPLQVTLVPKYMVLEGMRLIDTDWALLLPAIFAPLGTFIMTQSLKAVPDEMIEAAELDGANVLKTLFYVLVPMSRSGCACVLLLSFMDGWNMVEQPIAYLKDFEQYPLIVALSYVPPQDNMVQLACCVMVLLPPLFLFLHFTQELAEGIALAGMKG